MDKMLNLNPNQPSTLRTAHVCVCVSLCTTVIHNRTVLIIFPLFLQTTIIAQMLMLSTGGERERKERKGRVFI